MKRHCVCAVCGRHFLAGRRSQRFCSEACRRLGYRRGLIRHDEDETHPALRMFYCEHCGCLVRVTEPGDRRKKFCSVRCERLYWKHRRKDS